LHQRRRQHPVHDSCATAEQYRQDDGQQRPQAPTAHAQLVGCRTVSMMYTTAFFVSTPPQTTFALPLTVKSWPLPETVSDAPSRVGCFPASSAGCSFCSITWYLRVATSCGFLLGSVSSDLTRPGGSLANA